MSTSLHLVAQRSPLHLCSCQTQFFSGSWPRTHRSKSIRLHCPTAYAHRNCILERVLAHCKHRTFPSTSLPHSIVGRPQRRSVHLYMYVSCCFPSLVFTHTRSFPMRVHCLTAINAETLATVQGRRARFPVGKHCGNPGLEVGRAFHWLILWLWSFHGLTLQR